jgi:hypothetical protein
MLEWDSTLVQRAGGFWLKERRAAATALTFQLGRVLKTKLAQINRQHPQKQGMASTVGEMPGSTTKNA